MTSNRFISHPGVPGVEVRITDKSPIAYKDHAHPELSIGAMTDGATRSTIGGGEYVIRAGASVIIPPDVVHSCNPTTPTRSYCMAYIDLPTAYGAPLSAPPSTATKPPSRTHPCFAGGSSPPFSTRKTRSSI